VYLKGHHFFFQTLQTTPNRPRILSQLLFVLPGRPSKMLQTSSAESERVTWIVFAPIKIFTFHQNDPVAGLGHRYACLRTYLPYKTTSGGYIFFFNLMSKDIQPISCH